jgi:hypothetical protein
MSALVQPITEADSLAVLRQRMIREVEIFLEWSIARGGNGDASRIPTRMASPAASPAAGPASSQVSWYHGGSRRSSAAGAGETGPC